MSRHYSHINTAATILTGYTFKEPFASALKKYFSRHKKYGSRDRRQISHLCYSYFRVARMIDDDITMEEKLIMAQFLTSSESNPILEGVKPEYNSDINLTISEKIRKLGLNWQRLFPIIEELENGIDAEVFAKSHLIQPALFLRIRPGNEEIVCSKLDREEIAYNRINDNGLELATATKVELLLDINREVVIQDLSSQRVGELLLSVKEHLPGGRKPVKVWDCCAASGGKSILAVDVLGRMDLHISDIRKSILHNLKKRFEQAGIRRYRSGIYNLLDTASFDALGTFNLIIADVPCSGSGSWGRTPEWLSHFGATKLEKYTELQKQICDNVLLKLKPGGFFLYITCSVFKKENSDRVTELLENNNLELLYSQLIKGYEQKADTMYAALLRKPI